MSAQISSTKNVSNDAEASNHSGSTRFEARFLICSRDAGAIIGKKGSNIQMLRQKHRAIIQVPDCSGPERILSIQGDYDRSLAVIVDVLPLMRDNQRVQTDQSEIRLLVHQSQAGAVIGKGGERVRELRTRFNVGMKVFIRCLPFSTERVTALRGRADDIERCLRVIFELLEKTPPRGQTCFYDPINFDATTSSEYGGFADGTHLNNGNHAQPQRVSNEDSSETRTRSESNDVDSKDSDSLKFEIRQVTLPKRYISAIIGVGGAKIAEIRQISRAKIHVEDSVHESDDRIITIQGTNNQINYAQQLLQNAVRQSPLWQEN